jgi:hypothetical protein
MATSKLSHAVFLFLFLFSASITFAEVSILEQTPSSTTIEINADDWKTLYYAEQFFSMPVDAGLDDREGEKITPFYLRTIGLPSNEKPVVTIEEIRWSEVVDSEIPFGISPISLFEDTPPLYGNGPVLVSDPYDFRHRWVSGIYVLPVQEVPGGLRHLEYIRLNISYGSAPIATFRSEDRLVESMLLNGKQAKNWKKAQRSALNSSTQLDEWPSGIMLRFEIQSEGIYEITPELLESNGIDLSGHDPRKFRIFNNGGQMLAESLADPRPEALIENAIIVEGEADGSFDEGDRIIFYGRAHQSWIPYQPPGEYRHTNHVYSNANVYWLNIPDEFVDGKRMGPLEADGNATFNVDVARTRYFSEKDNLIYGDRTHNDSGKRWYTSLLSQGQSYSLSFEVDNPVSTGQDITIWIGLNNMSSYNDEGIVFINNTAVDTVRLSQSVQPIYVDSDVLYNGSNTFRFTIKSGKAYFDWFEISYKRNLETSQDYLTFDAFTEDGLGEVQVSGLDSPWIFNIQEFANVTYTRSPNFIVESQVTAPDRYIGISDNTFKRPNRFEYSNVGDGEYPNGLRDPNLGFDYILITHDDFYETSAPLEEYIEQRDEISVVRVKTSDIYQEFSWGIFDATAIRDFLKYTYDSWQVTPHAVLLVGDGDYDFRNIVSNADKNWVPTYQEGQICRDDWFVSFDDGRPQMVTGRLTVQATWELENYIENLIVYDNNTDVGPWRSRMILVADDEYTEDRPTTQDKLHMRQAEDFAADNAPDYLDIERIYIGTYPTAYDPVTGSRRKPKATEKLLEEINDGALLVSFIGHGNAHIWCHEDVLSHNRDGSLINSGYRLPLYIAATCSWGHFDRPENQSHPEDLIVQPGGAIGVIAATRATYPADNDNLTTNMYNRLFDREIQATLGEALFYAKSIAGGSAKYYHCLAEPMLHPALPRLDVSLASMAPDSLTALDTARVDGNVYLPDGTPVNDYNGEATITIFDSPDTLFYAYRHPTGSYNDTIFYPVKGGTIFRGNVTVENGYYNAKFIVPSDVKYGMGNGWAQMYVYNDEEDGIGAYRPVAVSTTTASINDNTPPEIQIYFDTKEWRSGDMISPNATLYVDVFDTNGVNLTGEVGHEIMAKIDGNEEISLTRDFVYQSNSYTRGTTEKNLYNLEPGQHQLEIWAWDNANNYTRQEVTFVVVDSQFDIKLEDVLNWPNPFSDRTNFTFNLSNEAEVTIKIFTASGRLIHEIGPIQAHSGFNYPGNTSSLLEWDGRDQYGDPVANGVYLYKLKAEGISGNSDEVIGKLLRIR